MSKIQERLEQLEPYVIGIRYLQKLPLIDVIFKDKWVVPDSEIIKKEKGEGDKNYFMFYSDKEGIGIDELLDYAETIINLNVEREKKNELLKVKVKELQKVFLERSLAELEQMEFSFGPTPSMDFDPETISMDDEIIIPEVKVEEPKNEVKPKKEPKKEVTKKETEEATFTSVNNKIELPPKNKNGKVKVELETHELPTETLEGPCTHGPDEFCPKCMDAI